MTAGTGEMAARFFKIPAVYGLLDTLEGSMTTVQQNIRTMFDTAIKFLDKNNSVWSGTVAFADAVTRAKAEVALIDQASDKQQTPTTGVTEDKALARVELEDKTLEVADQIAAYAAKNSDMDLAAKVQMTKSSLDQLQDSDLEQAAERIGSLATADMAALADYDITAADVTELDGLRTAFAEIKTAPRGAAVERITSTATVAAKIRSARSIFRNEIDKLVTKKKKTFPDFYNGYFAARAIVNLTATQKKVVTPTPVPGGTPIPAHP